MKKVALILVSIVLVVWAGAEFFYAISRAADVYADSQSLSNAIAFVLGGSMFGLIKLVFAFVAFWTYRNIKVDETDTGESFKDLAS